MYSGNYPKDWNTVDSLENQGLPQSALEVVERILQQAKQEKNDPQILKALIFKAKYISQREEDGMEKSIALFESELPQLAFPANAVLRSMLGEMYENYLNQKGWQIRDRTQLAAGTPGDLLTWSVEDIEKKAFDYYFQSLENESALLKVPVRAFQDIILNGKNDSITAPLRPTLFDFLAFRAIEYASNNAHFLTEPEHKFELSQPEAFAPLSEFIQAKFETREPTSRLWLAMRLFQRVLAAHANDADASNRTVADLHRLKFAYQHAILEGKHLRYETALKNLIRQGDRSPTQAEVWYDLAAFYVDGSNQDESNTRLIEAVRICRETIEKYPASLGAKRCQNLLQQLLKSESDVQVEKYMLPDQPFLVKIDFKNLRKVWVKVVAFDHQDLDIRSEHELNDLPQLIKKLNQLPVLQAKTCDLAAAPEDYRRHSTETYLGGLPLGNYTLLVSENAAFDHTEGRVSVAHFTITRLAVFNFRNDRQTIFIATDRNEGRPLSGVQLEFFRREWLRDRYKNIKIGEARTHTDGSAVFDMPADFGAGIFATARLDNDRIVVDHLNYYGYTPTATDPNYQVRIFTDRAIYRPGQMVYFKAIALKYDKTGNPVIMAHQTLDFQLQDVNVQTKAKLTLKTGEYGSCHGAFTLPTTGLTGQMSVVCTNFAGSVNFSVEEYKRPKFEVVFEPVRETYRLGQPVKLRGKAIHFSGVPVSEGAVRYTVFRQASFPVWDWRLFRGGIIPVGNDRQITSGSILTDANGHFEVEFQAIADASLDARWKPIYHFKVETYVTDGTGETQLAVNNIPVGTVTLLIDLPLPETIALDSLKNVGLSITNLMNEPQHVKGDIEITKLVAPATPFKSRLWQNPDVWTISEGEYRRWFPQFAYKNEEKVENWGRQDFSRKINFDLSKEKTIPLHREITAPGWYEIKVSARDTYGELVEIKKVVEVQDPLQFSQPAMRFSQKTATRQDVIFGAPSSGQHFFVATSSLGSPLKYNWFIAMPTQKHSIPITASDKGGIAVSWMSVRDNRWSMGMHMIEVPRPEKELNIVIENFRNKLLPGEEEEWRIKISGKNKDQVAAELMATLYDASLDQLAPYQLQRIMFPTFQNYLNWHPENQFPVEWGQGYFFGAESYEYTDDTRQFQQLNWYGWLWGGGYYGTYRNYQHAKTDQPYAAEMAAPVTNGNAGKTSVQKTAPEQKQGEKAPPPAVRRNLQELVFFYPDLRTDGQGNLILKFKMNEALTRWKLRAMAHTPELATGLLEKELITQKNLMIQANPPRFFREGDEVEFSAKIANLTDREITGTATLHLRHASTDSDVSARFDLHARHQKVHFKIPAGGSMPVFWKLKVPSTTTDAVIWQVVAEAGNFSDGEEHALPVVTNRMLVTETIPLAVRGNQTQTFDFQSVKNSSNTLQPHQFTLEFTSNPVWYAVQALPYLMEYPHECSEQIFNRFYANALAEHVVQRMPNIRRVFEKWQGDAKSLQSNLSKNQALKTALLEETPWVLAAQTEAQQKQNIALLFQLNHMAAEREKALDILKKRQQADGGWAWFPGAPSNEYITAYILSNLMKLNTQLGVLPPLQNDPVLSEMVTKSAQFVARANEKRYHEIEKWVQAGKAKWDDDHLDGTTIFNLYALSFTQLGVENQKVRKYFLEQAEKYWLKKGLYSEGLLALILKRAGKTATAQKIVASLRERAIVHPELGMYWKQDWGWAWYQLPIETQSLMVEIFDEVANDRTAVENLRIWLLKNKQTHRWPSTKSTAEAITALLLRGDNWLQNNKMVRIELGNQTLQPQEVEVGTNYFKNEWSGKNIRTDFSKIKVENPNNHIVWGAAYYQYFENLDKIQHFQRTPLTISKQYFKTETTPAGKKLIAISDNTQLRVGDRIKVRIEIRVDRPMEFVHLKDMRPSGTEPTNVLSSYRAQDGLGYYESTKDLATHFFIDYLPRGTFVFEYELLASLKGNFSTGTTTLQCMYAPEFSSHSEGIRLTIN